MPQPLTAIADHDASYEDPIAFAAGDVVALSGRTELWDGHRWLWARAADGREGWVPDGIVEIGDGQAVALEDYDAKELTCRVGEILTGLSSTHGWTWCRNAAGDCGWVPARVLCPSRHGLAERKRSNF